MRKTKGKSTHKTKAKTKTKKKVAVRPKRTPNKASSRKKKPVKRQVRTASAPPAEIEVIAIIGEDFVDDAEATVRDPLDEHYPPDYGGSE